MRLSVKRRSEVFVSTTSKDLGSVRVKVTNALLAIGCYPVSQETFPPDYRKVQEMLRDKISTCDAVVHIIGMRYGEEPDPDSLPKGCQRRSYTQMEADFGRQLGKKVYLFVCPGDFPFDAAHSEEFESEEKQNLQTAYRRRILGDNPYLRTEVRDLDDLCNKIRELPLEPARLSGVIARGRVQAFVIMCALLAVLALLTFGIWWSVARTPEQIVTQIYNASPSLIAGQMRRAIEKNAQAEIEHLRQEGAPWEAIQQVRQQRELDLADLDLVVEGIVEDARDGHPIYREAIEVLENEGADALLAYLKGQEQTLDSLIEKQISRKQREETGLRQLLDVRRLEALSLEMNGRYDDALTAYRNVLKTDPAWIAPRLDLARLLRRRGEVVNPISGNAMLQEAEQLCRDVLVLLGDDKTPLWPITQVMLASTLRSEGERLGAEASLAKLQEAAAACRGALAVYTREGLTREWAITQNNLANILSSQGERLSGAEGRAKFVEAISAFRAVLEVRSRAASPEDWALTQNNLGEALWRLGERFSGAAGMGQLEEAETACRAALEVRTRQDFPEDWATTQNNLGNALCVQGDHLDGSVGLTKLEEAVTAYRAALEVGSPETGPQDWARTQNNLGNALSSQGERLVGEEGTGKLKEASTAYRAALKVYSRKFLPQRWATTQNNLAIALKVQGERLRGEAGVAKLEEAVVAYSAVLEVFTRQSLPQGWFTALSNMAEALRLLGELYADTGRYEDAVKSFQSAFERHQELADIAGAESHFSKELASDLAGLARGQLLLNQCQEALESAEKALELDASQVQIQMNRAHALLLLGRFEEAKAIYVQYANEDMGKGKTFAQTVIDDFGILERAGLAHTDIARIRSLFTQGSS